MAQKWNLQDIRPPEPRRKRAPAPSDLERRERPPAAEDREEIPSVVIEDGRTNNRWQLLTAVAVFLVIVGGAFALSGFLGKTEVTIEPIVREPNINAEFTAYPEPRENALAYEVMTLTETGEARVVATGREDVENQASGEIEISKTTPGTQRLIKNTRFRTPDGRVYRIEESVVVPGAVSGNDGERVPGSVRAQVFAEATGAEYNLEAGTRFEIPGFAENGFDELFNAMYATNPEPIDGGFVGPRFIIPDDTLTTKRQELQVQLRDTLLPRIEQEMPNGYLTFPGAVAFTYNRLPSEEYGDGSGGEQQVIIKEEAVMHVPIFAAAPFAEFLAAETIARYEGSTVRMENAEELSFSYTENDTEASVLADQTALSFELVGRPRIVWEYDDAALREDLAGKPKTAINQILGAYPGIDSARASVQPFWRRSFPNNPDAINTIEIIEGSAAEREG